MLKQCTLTPAQDKNLAAARVAFMSACPFFAHFFYSELKLYPTRDVPTAATDSKRLFVNPDYLDTLRVPEIVFLLAHETEHAVARHPQRMKFYANQGTITGLPFDTEFFNRCADFIINKTLVDLRVGMCNPAWLYDPDITEELVEDLYERLYKERTGSGPGPGPTPGGDAGKKRPPNPGGTGGQGNGQLPTVENDSNDSTYGQFHRGGKPDQQAVSNGGTFDQILEPMVDPSTGTEDVTSEATHRQAVLAAADQAKAQGKFPGQFERMVDGLVEHQVPWREMLRMTMLGRVSGRKTAWDRPDRRRLALSRGEATKMVIMPGRSSNGAGTIAVAIDTSGSIGELELRAFLSEVGGIIADVSPRMVYVIYCDAEINWVEQVKSLYEVEDLRVKGMVGGGGTDFRPVFEWITSNHVEPEMLVYLTDGFGPAPNAAPSYDVIWALTRGGQAQPFGEHVTIEI